MRTTIDIPEELLRRAKAIAALRGIPMKDLVAEVLKQGLAMPVAVDQGRVDHGPLPEIVPARGRKIPFLTNADLMAVLDEEETAEQHHRSA